MTEIEKRIQTWHRASHLSRRLETRASARSSRVRLPRLQPTQDCLRPDGNFFRVDRFRAAIAFQRMARSGKLLCFAVQHFDEQEATPSLRGGDCSEIDGKAPKTLYVQGLIDYEERTLHMLVRETRAMTRNFFDGPHKMKRPGTPKGSRPRVWLERQPERFR